MRKWTGQQAWEWYRAQPFLFGCNFLPSSSVNSTDMWQADTFDADTIARELHFASGVGYNTIRVFLPYIVWESDPDGLKQRVDAFLSMAEHCGISVMFVLLDDCAFAGREAYLGRQADPVPGVHNSQWTPSHGPGKTDDPATWPAIQEYVQDIVSALGDDERVLIWDLYNEPKEASLPLVEAVFDWAREKGPRQPLTVGSYAWQNEKTTLSSFCEENSDVVSFHCYADLDDTRSLVETLERHERPLLCTEWLHRPRGSRFQTHLPVFKERNVGIYNWGLVVGRTQTNLNWQTLNGAPDAGPEEWQHDVLRPDGEVYDPGEMAAIRQLVGEDLLMQPVEMTPRVMEDLEQRGLIIRLRPDGHVLDSPPGETLSESIYESADQHGPHKLITVTVNRQEFAGFATHPDNEEFLLLGNPETKPLYLAVALCMREQFEEKVRTGSLRPDDLVLLRCKYNDPDVSFFVMLKDVPHGEAILEAERPPATFYVTESRDLPLDIVEMRKYRLRVKGD